MNPGMLKKLKKMQDDMMKAQRELNESIFYGSAGGGIVEVKVKGTKEVIDIKINPEAFEGKDDLEMIQDTIIAAINDAMRKIDRETEDTMGPLTQSLGGMPGLF